MASKISGINGKITIYILLCIVITFYVTALVGTISNSPGIPDIFFIKISPSGNSSSGFQARVGYFGLCAGAEKNLVCGPSNGATSSSMASRFNKNVDVAPLLAGNEDHLSLALKIQSQLLPPILAVGGVFFVLGIVSFFLWQRNMKMVCNGDVDESKEEKHLSTQRTLKISTLTLIWASLGTSIASVIAVTLTISALRFNFSNLTPGVAISTSPALNAVQWLIVSFSLVFNALVTTVTCETDEGDDVESNQNSAGKHVGGTSGYPQRPPQIGSAPGRLGPPGPVIGVSRARR